MSMVGRKAVTTNERIHIGRYKNYSMEALVDTFGEPYYLDGPFKNMPLILVYRSGTFWQSRTMGLDIIGEPIDSDDVDLQREILEHRRHGNVYGRWFSSHCPEGEIGFVGSRALKPMKESDYDKVRAGFLSKLYRESCLR